jgi:cytochrome c oxidase cbb3-type subunit 3
MSADMQNYIGYGAIVAMLLVFLIALLVLLRAFKVLPKWF